MAEMMNAYDDIEVDHFTEADIPIIKENASKQTGYTWEQLEEQARADRFHTETARRVWFVASSLV